MHSYCTHTDRSRILGNHNLDISNIIYYLAIAKQCDINSGLRVTGTCRCSRRAAWRRPSGTRATSTGPSAVQYSTVQYTCAVQVPHLPRRRLRPVRQVLRQADEAVLLAPRHLRLPPGAGMAHLTYCPHAPTIFKFRAEQIFR